MKLLFYSWDKVVKQCDGKIDCILTLFKTFNTKSVPTNLIGDSFMINLDELLSSLSSDVEKIEYLYLCSLRNYFDYKYQNNAKLYLYFSPISVEKISRNSLLKLENDYIKFIYEENHGN